MDGGKEGRKERGGGEEDGVREGRGKGRDGRRKV